jgi:hypothetical protein
MGSKLFNCILKKQDESTKWIYLAQDMALKQGLVIAEMNLSDPEKAGNSSNC